MTAGASRAVIAKQRREIKNQIDAEHRRVAKEKLVALRAAIRDGAAHKKAALAQAVSFCRAERLRARFEAKEIRARVRDELRRARADEIIAARKTCADHKCGIRTQATDAKHKSRAALASERNYQRELRLIEGRHRKRTNDVERTLRRQETDEEVRGNIPPELLALWARVRRGIKGNDRKSRTEAFLEHAEQNPHEVLEAQMDLGDRELAKLVRAEAKLAKVVVRRAPPTAAELAAIPF